jgi:hypothetical protein
MYIDLYATAVKLLEQVANSVHDRDNKNVDLSCFSVSEVLVVRDALSDIIREAQIRLPKM